MSVAWVGAGIAAVGAVSNASAAKKAGKAQQAGADASIASQEYMFDETNRLNAPYRDGGLLANNSLLYGLGLGNGQYSANGMGLADTSGAFWRPDRQKYGKDAAYTNAWDQFISDHMAKYGVNPGQGSDVSALPYELEARGYTPSNEGAGAGFGGLTQKYDQSTADNDYIYQTQKQFGLDEGTKGINRIAAANGGLLSGAAAKALTRFGNDYAGTKLNESYNRFTNDQNNQFNKLAAVSGMGQVATNQVAAAGQNMANNNSATQVGLGNARGASSIAQGNALTNGLSSAYNGYQQNRLINQPKQQAYYGSGGMGGFGDSYSTSYGE